MCYCSAKQSPLKRAAVLAEITWIDKLWAEDYSCTALWGLGLRKSRKSRARFNSSARLNLARFWLRDLRDSVPIKTLKYSTLQGEIVYFQSVKWDAFWRQLCKKYPKILNCSWKLRFRFFVKAVNIVWFLKIIFFLQEDFKLLS